MLKDYPRRTKELKRHVLHCLYRQLTSSLALQWQPERGDAHAAWVQKSISKLSSYKKLVPHFGSFG